MNYTLRATPTGWKAWDVTIEGISYVKNFQTDFGAEINEKGLEHVIERLEGQQRRGGIAAKAAGSDGVQPRRAGPGSARGERRARVRTPRRTALAAGLELHRPRGSHGWWTCTGITPATARGSPCWSSGCRSRARAKRRLSYVIRAAQILALARTSDLEELLLVQSA